jgi:tetratricopeptide (TPR) repeat protein
LQSGAAWGRLGEIYDVHGFGAEALSCYERAHALDPGEWRWLYLAGLVARQTDQRAAMDLLSRAAAIQPEYATLQLYLGLLHLNAEDLAGAEAHYANALRIEPGSVNALLGLGRVALARGDAAAALPHLERAALLAAEEPLVHHYLAQIYRQLGQEERALQEERLSGSGAQPGSRGGMVALSDPVREEIIEREGTSIQWLLQRSDRYLARGRRADALNEVEQALAIDPTSSPLLLQAGKVLAEMGNLTEARARTERAVELDPNNALARAALGKLLAASGRTPAAVQEFERALELDPTLAEVQNNLAAALFELGRDEEGLALLRAASQALTDNPDAQFNLAAALVMSDRWAEAVPVLEASLRLRPDDPDALLLLGRAQAALDQPDSAVKTLRRTLELKPEDAEARVELGRSLWRLARHAEAIEALRAALRAAPDDAGAARELAWALATCPREELRDGAQALDIARRLTEGAGARNPRLLDILAAAQAETGDLAGAARTMRASLDLVEGVLSVLPAGQHAAERQRIEEFRRGAQARLRLYESGRPYRDRP